MISPLRRGSEVQMVKIQQAERRLVLRSGDQVGALRPVRRRPTRAEPDRLRADPRDIRYGATTGHRSSIMIRLRQLPLEPGYLPDERVVGESLVEPSLTENRKHL
jgi:hypothetical protein